MVLRREFQFAYSLDYSLPFSPFNVSDQRRITAPQHRRPQGQHNQQRAELVAEHGAVKETPPTSPHRPAGTIPLPGIDPEYGWGLVSD
jgi:hypothetical protein